MQRLSSSVRSIQPRVVFSGIQPTGIPHLGNYVGALRQWVQFQHHEPQDTTLIYSIVDLHAITTPQPPEKLRQWKRESLAALLAIGIDPSRSIIFYQSSVSPGNITTRPMENKPSRATWSDTTVETDIGTCPLRAHVDSSLHSISWISLSHDPMEGAHFLRERRC
jgi:hypothetical protein